MSRSRLLNASLSVSLAAAAFAGAAALTPIAAEARPQTLICRISTYFSSASYTQEVGVRTTCPGGAEWGRTSPYRRIQTVQVDFPRNQSPPGSPTQPPCEFRENNHACLNLPTARPYLR